MTQTVSPKILAVIPARGGSKGLPGKNIRPLFGKPLLAYSWDFAQQLGPSVDCIVSTDDPEIARVAREAGANVPFLRPAELATDEASTMDALKHAVETMQERNACTYDMVLLLEPTSPTRRSSYAEQAIAQLTATPDLDGVIAVSEPFFNPVWVGVRPVPERPELLERYFPAGTGVVRRQQIDTFRHINGSFYIWRTDFVRKAAGSWFDAGMHGFVEVPELEAFSIDNEREFLLIEAVVKAGLAPLPGFDAAAG